MNRVIPPNAPDRLEQLDRLVCGLGVDSTNRADLLFMAISKWRGADWSHALEHHWSACDNNEEAVDELMKRVAESPPPRKDEKSKKKSPQKNG